MSAVTVVIEPEGGGRFTGRIEIGLEAFVAAGPRREFEIGGPAAVEFRAGDRVRITIPEYEFSDSGRVVRHRHDSGSASAVLIRTPLAAPSHPESKDRTP